MKNMTKLEGTQIRRRSPLLHNKSKYKQEDFDEHNQPKFRHISTYNNNLLQTQYNSASAAAAAHCSHLSESRDCSINSCFSWKVEKKEECFLPSKEQKCGKGTRKLLYTCVDHNGVSFTSYICKNIPQLGLLKNKKNVLPFDSMDYARVRCKMTTKRGKHNFLLLIFQTKPLNQRKLHWF